MLRLDQDLDFRGHFSASRTIPLLDLAPEAAIEDVLQHLPRPAAIGYADRWAYVEDGMLAADPTVSQAFCGGP